MLKLLPKNTDTDLWARMETQILAATASEPGVNSWASEVIVLGPIAWIWRESDYGGFSLLEQGPNHKESQAIAIQETFILFLSFSWFGVFRCTVFCCLKLLGVPHAHFNKKKRETRVAENEGEREE